MQNPKATKHIARNTTPHTTKLIFGILSLLRPYGLQVSIAALALMVVVACLLSFGHIIKHFVDDSSSNIPFLYLVVIITLFGAGSLLRSLLINSVAEYAANDAKRAAFSAALALDPSKIDEYSFSDLASRINGDSEYIARVITDLVSFFIRNAMTTIGGITMMCITSPKLSVIAFALIALITICASFVGRKIRLLATQAEAAKSRVSNIVLESIINFKVVSAFSEQEALLRYFDITNQDAKSKITTRIRLRSAFFASTITSILLTIVGIIWYGNIDVKAGYISSGTLASFLFYSFMTAVSFGGIIEMFGDLEKHLASCQRLFEILNLAGKLDKVAPLKLPTKLPNNIAEQYIELKDISYAYSARSASKKLDTSASENVLQNFDMQIPLNKFSVLTGKSGCGKTTILNLVMGLYSPIDGEFIIGGQQYSKMTPALWGGKLAYVPQDNMLFSGSILQNVTFFEDEPSPKPHSAADRRRVMDILDGLDLSDLISELPSGLDSNTGSLSTKISGGQKQRIAIARALYKNPEILILDEATSQLDEETESLVLKYIAKLMDGKTVICVAHRKAATLIADEVIQVAS